jgi:hypothetical protein
VRSSARDEAVTPGRYRTLLDVPMEPGALRAAIAYVLAGFDDDPRHELVIQTMVAPAIRSGVILTRDPETGAPYDVIEYDDESDRTDRVTAGTTRPKRVAIHHDTPGAAIATPAVRRLRALAARLRRRWPGPALEIEFAESRQRMVHVVQVRPVETCRRWTTGDDHGLEASLREAEHVVQACRAPRAGIVGTASALGQMPDWNPAELLGHFPRPLTASVFDHLIADHVWHDARGRLGYRSLPRTRLVVLVAGRPYVDVRSSFNSFLPADTDDDAATRLVDAWLARLRSHPDLHDKVELEIVHTAADFDFASTYQARYAGVLRVRERDAYRRRLRELTAALVTTATGSSLPTAVARIARDARHHTTRTPTGATNDCHLALEMLERCRRTAARCFAVIARHAFVAEALLRSAERRGALSQARRDAFKQSLVTCATRYRVDLARMRGGTLSPAAFMRTYGHLRPGTFDIRSPRYDHRGMPDCATAAAQVRHFAPTPRERRALDLLQREAGLAGDTDALLRYAATAITGREHAKFLMSRPLSDALEQLAAWGATLGISRDGLSFLTLDDLRHVPVASAAAQRRLLRGVIASRRAAHARHATVRLGPLLWDERDVRVARSGPGIPTFVTTASVVARCRQLTSRSAPATNLTGTIVCVEQADPGFDWIFAHAIAGLITRYGGSNSHMTIRCTELDLPAAIGVGDALFARLAAATHVELRCGEGIIRPACDASA